MRLMRGVLAELLRRWRDLPLELEPPTGLVSADEDCAEQRRATYKALVDETDRVLASEVAAGDGMPPPRRLVWYRREDGLWNAACACNATICGVPFADRARAESAHFDFTYRIRAENGGNQIPGCGPALPEPNPNIPGPLVFP